MTSLFEPLAFARGPAMKNRFMLAPMTNCQSHDDGRLSDEELAARRAAWAPRRHDFQSGAIWRYAQTVSPARYGAVVHPGGAAETHNYFES